MPSVRPGHTGEGEPARGTVLRGIRVLDFGRYIAGPYCAALLAEHGAEVIRVERRGGGEDRWVQPVAAGGEGTLFLQVNRNKRSMTLDPTTLEGREVVRRLVATADVVVANLPPQTLIAMGLDYQSLVAVKPDVILTTTTAYGRGGPYSDRVGFDMVGQAMSGAVYLSGDPGEPRRATVPWVDFGTALHAAFGTMVALLSRQQTGKGQVVEGSLLATALSLNNATLIEQAVLETNRLPTGNRSQTSAPADVFRTEDGWIVCQVLGPSQFGRWARLMGEDHWLSDPRFADDLSRGTHGEAGERAHVGVVRGTDHDAGARGARPRVDPRRAGAHAAAGAGRSARPPDGPLRADRLPRPAETRPGRQGGGVTLRDAGGHQDPGAHAGRAHRRHPRRARLRRGRDRRAAPEEGGLSGCRWVSSPRAQRGRCLPP